MKARESNIELLRCICMFMILVIHANFVSLPKIGYDELMGNTVPSVTRFFIELLGIVAVNVFVLISGYFGIRPRLKSVLSFIYLVLFFLLGGGLLFILFGKAPFSFSWLLDVFQLSGKDWFIKSYLVLMIISPVLNSFSENASEITQRYVILSFVLFEAVFGWAAGGSRIFVSGYGPLHFIGLYLIASYIHRNRALQTELNRAPSRADRLFCLPSWVDLCTFFVTVIINTLFVVVGSYLYGQVLPIHALAYSYSNPLVIIGALYIFLFFEKLKVRQSKLINWLGASCFAVYLFHGEQTVRSSFFSPSVQYIYSNYSGFVCLLLVFCFLCGVFCVACLLDQLRLISWNRIWKVFNSKTR